MKVLIIDDCAEMTALLKAYLADPQIEALVANDGKQGLELFKDGRFDVVLLDIEMPVMDGYAALAEMRRFEGEHRRDRSPIMALTAASDMTSSYRILSSGFDLHLVKPISRVTLLQTVGQFRRKLDVKVGLTTEAPARQQLGDHLPWFVERRTQDLLKLQSAVNSQDYGTIRDIGESLKNVATSFGLDSLARIGLKIESSALSRQEDAIGAEIEAYDSYLKQLQTEAAPHRTA
jgi:CheY-like chemotaxis protein